MGKVKDSSSMETWLLAIALTGSSVIGIVLFYFELLEIHLNSSIVSYIYAILFFGIFLVSMCGRFRKQKSLFFQVWYLYVIIFFYLLAFGSSFIRFGMLNETKSFLITNIFFNFPTMILGSLLAYQHMEYNFFKILEKISIVIIPAVMLYVFWGVFDINPSGAKVSALGSRNYMHVSYTIIPFFLSSIILFCSKKKTSWFSLSEKWTPICRAVIIVIYWLALLIASTRNAILSAFIFFVMLYLYSIIQRYHLLRERVVLLVTTLIVVFIFLVFWTPDGFSRMSRFEDFITNFSHGEFSTVDKSKQEILDVELIVSTISKKTEEIERSKDIYIRDRASLFKIAYAEIIENPKMGLGPMGFFYKYDGYYPHNIFLELLVECGLFFGSVFSIVIMGFFLSLLRFWEKRSYEMLMWLFFSAYIPRLLSSGTIWDSQILLFGMGYAMTTHAVLKKEIGYNEL